MSTAKANVEVRLYNSNNVQVGDMVLTDENGRARFNAVPSGTYRARVTLPAGYAWKAEHADNDVSDTNVGNNLIEEEFGLVVIEGIDIARNGNSTATVIIDLTYQVGFNITYTPGVGMTIKLQTFEAVTEENVIVVNWSLKAIDHDNNTVIRHAGDESTFTIAIGQTLSDSVVVSNGFDDGQESGLDPAPVDTDTFWCEIVSKPSLAVIDDSPFALASAGNWNNLS